MHNPTIVTVFPNSSTKNGEEEEEHFQIWVNTVYIDKHSLVFLYTYFPSPLQKLAFSKKKKSYITLSCTVNISDISTIILFSSAGSPLKFTSLPYDYNYGQLVSYLAFLY